MNASFLCFLGLFLVSITSLYARTSILSKVEIEQGINQAEALLISSKSDSALLYLQPIMDQLEGQNQSNSLLGLKLRLILGMALENDGQSLKAIRLLNQLKIDSRQQKEWKIYVGTNLTLAKLQEALHRKATTREQLDEAKKYIQQYGLNELQANFDLRLATWHLHFGYPDSTQFYAQKTIKAAEVYDLPHLKAEGLRIIAQLKDQIGYDQAIEYNRKSIHIRKGLEDYFHLAQQFHQMAEWYSQMAQYETSLTYNDSTIAAAYLAIASGRENIQTLHHAYLLRGSLYRVLGSLDTAYHYLNRGYVQQINYLKQQENERIIEIDEQFKNQQKNQQIASQKQQIYLERQRSFIFQSLSSLILLLAGILIYAYWRLRKASKKTQRQSEVISETNKKLATALEHQVVLQGEIHHRVKNSLQVIVSLLELQKEELKEEASKASLEAMANRIYSIAAIHEVLYQKEGENLVNFLEYSQKICGHFSNLTMEKKPIFNLQIPPKTFNIETLMPLGIILNELLTNSLKYARIPNKKLKIDISLGQSADGFQLYYHDNGPGFTQGHLNKREGGLGFYLLNSMSRQLMGKLETENNQGAAYRIYFQEKNKRLT